MQAIVIPAKTLIHINGVPVRLAVDTIVEAAPENACYLNGYSYAYLPAPPPAPVAQFGPIGAGAAQGE